LSWQPQVADFRHGKHAGENDEWHYQDDFHVRSPTRRLAICAGSSGPQHWLWIDFGQFQWTVSRNKTDALTSNLFLPGLFF
jgi:hypothetical protein